MEKYLYEQNIHWGHELYAAGIEREQLTAIMALIEIDQVIAITGIRRCGKSYLLKQIANQLISNGVPRENILLLNLELPSFGSEGSNRILDTIIELYLRLKNPEGRLYIFLDEIQTISEWEIWLKYNYDQKKGKLKFFITGSNSGLLSSEFASRLSGRIIEKLLFPFSFKEYLTARDYTGFSNQELSNNKQQILHYLDQYMEYGGMPELLNVKQVEVKRELLLSYFNTIIFKDIIARYSLRNNQVVPKLALFLLSNSSSLLNIKKLADYLRISKREVLRDYLDYLEQVYLNFVICKFDYSLKVQLLSQKKGYCIDNGFVNLLPLRFSQNQGKQLENLVFLELKRRGNKVYYYQKNGYECDFIVFDLLQEPGAYQVCHEINENTRKREITGLLAGCQKLGITSGSIITFEQEDEEIIDGVKISTIPYWKWVLTSI
ncbi:MAG: ATP-binding protein [Candidatus Cloacimonetes bacterium]|nr:ATP-binding protein [Candidatus Cloacimonadota bacterium]